MCISNKILAWYRPEDRDLPWRRTEDAYHIWVSEIMLQQTQAQTVIPYYERFMAKFPTAEALADADEEDVLKMWQGLGYYRRARHLLEAARIVKDEGMPSDFKTLKQLPGIGDYTAAAIASIAFHEPVAAIDGNLLRIYSRLYCITEPVDRSKTKRRIFERANDDISRTRPGDFNQAMMDLGNKICTPTRPLCLLCPLREECRAFKEGVADELPHKTPKKKQARENYTLLLLDLDGDYLVEKRTEGLLQAMWGFPLLSGHLKKEDIQKYLSERDFMIEDMREMRDYRHVFSHKIWNVSVVYVKLKTMVCAEDRYTWANRAALEDVYAIPSAFQPALEVIDALD
ncbi:MAG: A/G-specific adenine glycosylase [Firmicutes bacterium]|nr:A/G-specific adenine glycosylase [Bacillota bacterium]